MSSQWEAFGGDNATERLISSNMTLSNLSFQFDEKFKEIRGPKVLGLPTSNVTLASDGLGFYQNFSDGVIIWTPHPADKGIFYLSGDIYDKWENLGLERSYLGNPITDERFTPHKDGAYARFQNGAIYTTPLTGVHAVRGEIYKEWESLGLERSYLGYPVTDLISIPEESNGGAIAYFQGGAIRWTEKDGALAMHSKDYADYFNHSKKIPPTAYEKANNTYIKDDLKLETLSKSIEFPTSMAMLGSDDLLVLEKNEGTVRRIINGVLLEKPLLDVNVASSREEGMLGIAIADQDRNRPRYVFLYFTESRTKDSPPIQGNTSEVLGNRLYRYELAPNGTALINPKLLLSLPVGETSLHNGGKILVGPDNNVYLIVGNLDNSISKSQNVKNGTDPDGTGVIYRIDQDGKAPPDNPLGNGDPINKYFAYGIRNGFGIDFDPQTGNLWDTENGPGFGDEINLVEPGFNSGWKQVQGLEKDVPHFNHDTDLVKALSDSSNEGRYRDPEFVWNQTVGVTALKFYNSGKLGMAYKDGLFVGDYVNGNLYYFNLNDTRTGLLLDGVLSDKIANNPQEAETSVILKGFGSITDLQVGPDGYLYIAAIQSYYPVVNTAGIIYKLLPN